MRAILTLLLIIVLILVAGTQLPPARQLVLRNLTAAIADLNEAIATSEARLHHLRSPLPAEQILETRRQALFRSQERFLGWVKLSVTLLATGFSAFSLWTLRRLWRHLSTQDDRLRDLDNAIRSARAIEHEPRTRNESKGHDQAI